MTRDAFLLSKEPIARGALDALARARGAAWVIEPKAGRVLAANRAGLARLSLRRDGGNASLDGAMPALVRLREISASKAGPARTLRGERFVFWTAAGAVAITCDVAVRRGPGPLVVTATAEAAGHDRELDPAAASPLLRELAHELRTPLSAIAAAAEIMRDERLGPLANARYKGYATHVHDAAVHALAVVERLLGGGGATGRAGAPLDAAPVDVNQTVRSLVAQVAPLAERARVRLALDLARRAPAIAADATALRQMVLNLLTNALKFTPAGGLVTVATRRLSGGALAVEVSDTGPGMSKREIAQTLDAKPRPRSGPRRGGGLGLGLPLVRTLAEANGARLVIESGRGKGTSARIVFAKSRN